MMSLGYPLLLFLLSLRGLGSLELKVDLSLEATLEGRGHLEKTFPRWGPEFHIAFDVQIKPKANWKKSGWHSVLHLTTGPDYETPSSRIPGVWLYPSKKKKFAAYLVVQMQVNGTIHEKYYGLRGSKRKGSDNVKVDLRQKYGAFKMTVDDQRLWSQNTGEQSWQNVQFWLPSPFNLPASDVAYIKNVVVVNEPRKRRPGLESSKSVELKSVE